MRLPRARIRPRRPPRPAHPHHAPRKTTDVDRERDHRRHRARHRTPARIPHPRPAARDPRSPRDDHHPNPTHIRCRIAPAATTEPKLNLAAPHTEPPIWSVLLFLGMCDVRSDTPGRLSAPLVAVAVGQNIASPAGSMPRWTELWLRWCSTGPRSGDSGADPVAVELEQVVDCRLQAPFRAHRGSASSLEPAEAAVELARTPARPLPFDACRACGQPRLQAPGA